MIFKEEFSKKHFPYAIPNAGQMECITQAVDTLGHGVKHVIIEAPTGIGKSAIAYTIHKALNEINMIVNKKEIRSRIITSTKNLQDQYIKEFPEIDNLMGKTNYTCPHGVGPYSSVDCKQKIKGGCKPELECPYIKARNIWCNKSKLGITNHSFMIEACPMIVMEEHNKCELIFIDECHEAEMNIINHSILKLSVNDFNSSMMMKRVSGVKDLIAKTVESLHGKVGSVFISTANQRMLLAQLADACKSLSDELIEASMNTSSRATLAYYSDIIEKVQAIEDRATLFCSTYEGTWLISACTKGQFIEIKPVYASQVAEFGLFRKAQMFVHMSSTICGVEQYKKSLGLKDEECYYIKVDNPIPVASRPIRVYPNFKVSKGFENYKALANSIDLILDHHHNESGIIHTVSFDLANKIVNNSRQKKRMIVSNDRREILRHLSTKDGVVLSPSLEKGFDAKDDLSRFQILPKVPYAFLGDPLIEYNSRAKEDWYARNAILRIVQACGRSVRGINDHAETYILDSNFLRLHKENKYLFPDWFLDAVEIN